jgi:hypothetical protein
MLPKLPRKWIPALCAAMLLAAPAAPTTLARMNFSQLTRAATVVVRAKCLGEQSLWERGEIWTLSRFEVLETFKGQAQAQFTVRLLGGRVDGIESLVAGVPHFRAGEQVVLFLDPLRRGGFSVTAWSEGTFHVDDDATGRPQLTQATTAQLVYDPATHKFGVAGVRRMPLAAFRRLMRKLTGQKPRLAPDASQSRPREGGR